jgi:isopentenyldiphosphate isomerase
MSNVLLDNPSQLLVCVDEFGKETGRVIDRRSGHTSPGVKHLAIQILVFNQKKELVLHERPRNKVGGGVLDSPTTHVLAGEKPIDSAIRCLENEYGIKKAEIKILGGYSYEKDYGDGSCENEYCLAAFTEYSGKIIPSASHTNNKIIEIPAKNVLKDIQSGSSNYPVWFKETVKIVYNDSVGKKFFL